MINVPDSARRVRTGSRWQIQNASRPATADSSWRTTEVNAQPLQAYDSTAVAENTMTRPISTSSPTLASSR